MRIFVGKNKKIKKWKPKEGKIVSQSIALPKDRTKQDTLFWLQKTDADLGNIKRNEVYKKNIRLAKQQLEIR